MAFSFVIIFGVEIYNDGQRRLEKDKSQDVVMNRVMFINTLISFTVRGEDLRSHGM
jgi:hypothetical protein